MDSSLSPTKMPRASKSGEFHPAFEEYCETIFELHEDSFDVIQARIAERLDVSRPAVSEMIKRMTLEGLVTVDSTIQLTSSGTELAEKVVRRHRLAERLLTDVLGLSWAAAHAEAGKWEHIISDEVESALMRVLDNPTTCPHGNPIPGSSYVAPETQPLDSIHEGQAFVIERIPEALEFADGMLDFLENALLLPGQHATMTSKTAVRAVIEVHGTSIEVEPFVSANIMVSLD